MGIGFIIVIAFLAGLLGMFARQALANVESDNTKGTGSMHSAADRKSEEEIELVSVSDWNAM